MRLAALIWVSGTALMLAACGSETSGKFTTKDGENAEYTIDKESGETSMTVKGPEVPVSLPGGFTLYPGAKVVTNTVVKQADGQGTMVMFETDAAPNKVVTHYREQAKTAGFDIQLEMTTNGTMMIGGERKDGSTLSVTASPGKGSATTGQLIIGSKTGG